jgi:manganese/zinc/iron transport system substrate-binding protein
MKFYVGWILAALFLLNAGCGPADRADMTEISERKIRVVATTGMITDAVERVGRDRVEVIGLMGPGVDPHLYKPSEGDVTRIAGADVLFYNGLHLEGKMTDIFDQMERRSKRTVPVTKAIDRAKLLSPPEFEGNYDPHVWFEVTLWMVVVETIRDTLADMDPEHDDLYMGHAEAYLKELRDLHEFTQAETRKVPEAQRVLITAHDAFNYFGRAYGFEVRGLQGISTVAEAGTGDVRELSRFIADRKIPAIFVESSVPRRNIEAVQAAVRSLGFEVVIGGELFSDALGTAGTPEGTYVGMTRHNVETIVDALSGGKE